MNYSTNNEACFVKSFGPFTITSTNTQSINQEFHYEFFSEEQDVEPEPENNSEEYLVNNYD